jgi:hypothetical protein
MSQNPKKNLRFIEVYQDDLRVRKWTIRLVHGMYELFLKEH